MKTNTTPYLHSALLTLLFSVPVFANSQNHFLLNCYDSISATSYEFSGDILGLGIGAPTNGFVEVTNRAKTQSGQPVQYVYRGWTFHQARFLLDGNKIVVSFSDLDITREYAPKTGNELLLSGMMINEDPKQSLHGQTKYLSCKFTQTEKL